MKIIKQKREELKSIIVEIGDIVIADNKHFLVVNTGNGAKLIVLSDEIGNRWNDDIFSIKGEKQEKVEKLYDLKIEQVIKRNQYSLGIEY